ncbi:MAG: hypothetical protein A2487_18260 [Candidatus Raymondbacteria bacterium RifOxyC12_full_50_8]|uniref:DUF4145 domain-containing protein n=1 Tax=Candidatus Raymondbacteria bacterium RIFOXYD12_FULL_49_13 TaxID=1817890 RepID=A0A1F7F5G0_UNCRA|nr:MAG: hypothetical protein A2350_08300 [Candidatus Raymondbacteria bacterium RifOxyB12_full_50_8]OGJ87174.1 MAG: hypothetical protein A2248_04025 [Candidatus Raymondbacteria bacterium RIFOXYA2_FULL_49_16]OGJ95345.1 MAG: hypothetical protein A2487_18260 [Candidatus Raymondbacteria bacterium RifOxyC12_full_50_8]OGK01823.1 MAG: hypothetical protein A2519_03100 [Candidatus Raymondbacteria bacterium RIFOXYD12_FULL_49_13]OGP41170.1 MAG: hypothetical protein A2324_08670 [Candidatus Raymondbacteria b
MNTTELYSKRFAELFEVGSKITPQNNGDGPVVDSEIFQEWAVSVLNLFSIAFGENNTHFRAFKYHYDNFHGWAGGFSKCWGVFKAAKNDFEGGYVLSVERTISGEVLGDFILLAKNALKSNNVYVAAVLACAALEDALKRYARANSLNVDEKPMQEVVSALKAKGLVSGASKTLLDTMPKIRDYALHANWEKISPPDVSSVIGFVEQFLQENF